MLKINVLQICMTWIKRQKRILSLGVGLKKVWLEGWNIKEEAPFELCDGEELPRSFTVNAVRFVESELHPLTPQRRTNEIFCCTLQKSRLRLVGERR